MPFELLTPSTVAEAVAAMANGPRTVAMAGGTDLLLDLEGGRVPADRVVSLDRLPWKTLERRDGRLRIGSLLPLRTLERDPALSRDLPGLFAALRSVGSVPLRHRATLGGNLARASPASDLIPILLALRAELQLVGPHGPRSTTLDAFLRSSRSVDLGAGELIEGVEVPERAASAYAWQRVRPSNDISQVGVAVAWSSDPGGWTVAVGGVVPRPVRLPAAEAVLRSSTPSSEEREQAGRLAARDAPIATDRRATEEYRRRLVAVLVDRAVANAVGTRGSA